MDFKQLEAFVYVVKLKSFSKTAEKLYLTPAHHQRPHQLFGERTGGSAHCPFGQRKPSPLRRAKSLYEYAQDMLTLRDNALSAFKTSAAMSAAPCASRHLLCPANTCYLR